uniref:Uncharacterized protein n=1 Tax=Mola mola TaxID=94237 RepID=A0A3Q3W7S6_MOLML
MHSFLSVLLCSPRRWTRSWGASVTKSLPSNLALKALIPTLWVGVIVIYNLGDKLRNFVTGIFIPQYHYPYSAVLVSLLFLNLLHVLGLVPLKHYSRSLGEKLLVPAICHSIHDVLAMWAKASSSYAAIYPLTIFFLKLASPPSIHICILISIVSVEPLEYMYASLALMLFGLCLSWLVKASEEERHQPSDTQSSIFDIYYTHLVNQSWILGLLWLLHPDNPWQVLSHSSWHSLLFHGYQLAILLLGMVLNFAVGASALCISPLAAALLHSAKPNLLTRRQGTESTHTIGSLRQMYLDSTDKHIHIFSGHPHIHRPHLDLEATDCLKKFSADLVSSL